MRSRFYPFKPFSPFVDLLEIPMPDASPFTPDFSKVDWSKISAGIAMIVAELANSTPTPIDDIAADFLATTLTEWLKNKAAQQASGLMMASSDEMDAAFLTAQMEARGKLLSPETLAAILSLAKTILPLLLPLLV